MMALDPLLPKQRRPLSPICAVNRKLGLVGFWRLTGALDPIVKVNTPRPRTEPLKEGDTDAAIDNSAGGGSLVAAVSYDAQWLF